jgi:HlyD family secretion protein
MLRKLLILTSCCLVLLAGCDALPRAPASPTPSPTAESSLPPTPIPTPVVETVVNADGTLVSLRPTLGLGFQVGGRVVEVSVRPGDSVKAGQMLARLDQSSFENAVRELDKTKRSVEAGTELDAAAKAVEAAKLGLVNAYGNYTSTVLRADVSTDVRNAKTWVDFWNSELGDAWLRLDQNPSSNKRQKDYELAGTRVSEAKNYLTKIQVDAANSLSAAKRGIASAEQTYLSAVANYETLKANDPVRQAELQVMLYETSLTRAQQDLANTELAAPWDAMVAEVSIAPGSQVGGGPAVTLVDVEQLQFVTDNLSERDVGHIAVGQTVAITLKAFPDAVLTGRVATIAPLSGQPVGDDATFAVRIDLDPTELALRPGMTGEVEIKIK